MVKKKFTDEDFLEYYNLGYSDAKMGKLFGCNKTTVRMRRVRFLLTANFNPFCGKKSEKDRLSEEKIENKEKKKQYQKQYDSRPENKEKRKQYQKQYDSIPEVKEKKRQYYSIPEVKEKKKQYNRERYLRQKEEKDES